MSEYDKYHIKDYSFQIVLKTTFGTELLRLKSISNKANVKLSEVTTTSIMSIT